MKKKTVRFIVSLVLATLLVGGGFFARDMVLFARGVIADTSGAEQYRLNHTLENGDIIFQTSTSSQSKAIQLATGSSYSHMGIIYRQHGKLYVYEAVQPVRLTPLDQWIARGKDHKYVVKRLKNAKRLLSQGNLVKMKKTGNKYLGKDYDIYFEWSDDRIYCSELVWKIYNEALGIEIGHMQSLKDFNLDNPVVKGKLKERYGDNIPLDEKMISPVAMYNSDMLYTVLKN